MHKRKEKGFVLPLTVMFMVIMTVSGINFLQMDFLERRTMRTELDNHTAFILANAGLERARETFKIPPEGNWTAVLGGTYDGDADGQIDYPVDPNPVFCDACLCGPNNDRGCVIPSFGDAVSTGLPFAGTFDDGQYQVRAFNNEPGTTDTDQSLTYRASGLIRGQQKMLEIRNAQTKTGMRVITCLNPDPSAVCPDSNNPNMDLEYMPGREPASVPNLPTWDQSYYQNTSKLPCSQAVEINGNTTLVPGAPSNASEVQLQSSTCYFVTGSATLQSPGTGWNNIVVFSNQALLVSGTGGFSNSIFISLDNIQLQGNVTLSSPKTPDYLPALISGGDITKGNASVEIDGNIYAVGSIGSDQFPWNPNQVTGSIIGSDVYLKAASTSVSDNNDPGYYELMPGFIYPPELQINEVTGAGSWRELQ